MKRALAIAVAVCTVGFAGFGIGTITGTWRGQIGLLPAVALTGVNELVLNIPVGGFTIVSESDFGAAGFTAQRFGLTGAFGPFTLTGDMLFDPEPTPLYMRSRLTTSFDFGGVSISAKAVHWAPGHWHPGFAGFPAGTADPCVTLTPPSTAGMFYTFSTTISPVTVRTRFLDCTHGIGFFDTLVTLTGLPLCCGITYGVELSFVRTGFGSVTFTGINIPIGLGVSFDVRVTYSVDAKVLELTPRIGVLGDACFTIWVDDITDAVAPGISFTGLELEGFRIRCTIGDCNYIEFVTLFDVASPAVPAAVRDLFLTRYGEFEYVGFGFCGAGCCGGRWTADFRIFMGTGGGLFDITRFTYTVSVPVMVNFTVTVGGTMFAVPVIAPDTGQILNVGWTLTF